MAALDERDELAAAVRAYDRRADVRRALKARGRVERVVSAREHVLEEARDVEVLVAVPVPVARALLVVAPHGAGEGLVFVL